MLGAGNPQSTTSLDLINSLQAQIAQQQASVKSDEVVFGDSYPKLIQDKAQLRSLQNALRSEIDRLAARAANDAVLAKEQEDRTRSEHEKLLRQANRVNDKYLQYQIVQQEAQDARQFYTDLNQRLREVSVTVGMLATDTTLFAPALAQYKPHYPRIPIVLVASILGGAFMGTLLAIILELCADKISSARMLESTIGISVFGLTPDYTIERTAKRWARTTLSGDESQSVTAAGSAIEILRHPGSLYAESMRSLRASLLLSHSGEPPKVFLITSSHADEGKSITALNLAATYARAGARTLLVEANANNPSLSRRLGLDSSTNGLSLMLTGQLGPEWTTTVPGISNLNFIPGGEQSLEPHELVGSDAMSQLLAIWRQSYDIVFIDGPPILTFAESVLLINQVDLTLLVTRYCVTSIRAIQSVFRLVPHHLHAHIGVLLNAVSPESRAYSEYYGYPNFNYIYQKQGKQGGASRG
jgi:capsular exopolysaccharide synthesis family protein